MKKILKTSVYFLLTFGLLAETGCFGSFSAVKWVYEKNNNDKFSKFGKTCIFWVLYIVPVYGIAAFLDLVLFNVIEFWGGKNPLAMAPGETETQYIQASNGEMYRVTATRNKFEVYKASDNSRVGSMYYKENSREWYAESKGKSQLLGSYIGTEKHIIGLATPAGQVIPFTLEQQNETMALLSKKAQ